MFVDMNQYYSKTFFFRETYRGSHAFSEPETRAIAQFILGKMKTQQIKVTSFNVLHMNEIRDVSHHSQIECNFIFQMYLTIHSYGQYFLYPWGYEKLDTHDRHELHNMGRIGAQAIQRVNSRRKYKVGSAAKMLYPASGKV